MRRWSALLLLLALCGCDAADAVNPNHLEGKLAMELRDELGVIIDVEPEAGSLKVKLTPNADYGLLPAGSTLDAAGQRMALPEAGGTLYTAKLQLPAVPSGPCGGDAISAALSLHRQDGSATVMGGLALYCGASTWHGVPVRMVRLAGDLPIPQ